MNFEEANSFNRQQKLSEAELKELQAKAEKEKEENVREFLRTRKIFKELLPDKESLEKFKQVRDFLVMNVVTKQIGLKENSDIFFRGYIDALDTIPTVIEVYDKYMERSK